MHAEGRCSLKVHQSPAARPPAIIFHLRSLSATQGCPPAYVAWCPGAGQHTDNLCKQEHLFLEESYCSDNSSSGREFTRGETTQVEPTSHPETFPLRSSQNWTYCARQLRIIPLDGFNSDVCRRESPCLMMNRAGPVRQKCSLQVCCLIESALFMCTAPSQRQLIIGTGSDERTVGEAAAEHDEQISGGKMKPSVHISYTVKTVLIVTRVQPATRWKTMLKRYEF
jgi:hypothetical protein